MGSTGGPQGVHRGSTGEIKKKEETPVRPVDGFQRAQEFNGLVDVADAADDLDEEAALGRVHALVDVLQAQQSCNKKK